MKKIFAVGVLFLLVGGLYAQNLLQNPGFETWIDDTTPQYWIDDDSILVFQHSDTVHSGTYSAKIVLLTQNQSFADFFQEWVPVNEGQDYELSFYVFDNDPAGYARIACYWFKSDSSYITSFYGNSSSNSPDWQLVADTATAPAGAAFMKFNIRFYDVSSNWDGDAIFYIDDASATEVVTAGPDTFTIQEIQGETSSSPLEGEVVVTYGIVTGVFGNNFFMEEQPGGAWHGIYVYRGSAGDPAVQVGDSIRITAEVDEYYGNTELKNVVSLDILASGVTVPGPTFLPTGDVPQEQYEGVFVKVDYALCTNPDLGYGEWEVDDGSGPVRVDDMGYSYTPTEDYYYMVQGPLFYSYGNYKIEPRDENDVYEYGPTLIGEKESSTITSVRVLRNPATSNPVLLITLSRDMDLNIKVFDITGRTVVTKNLHNLSAGSHSLNLGTLKSGVYFYDINSGLFSGKFVVVK